MLYYCDIDRLATRVCVEVSGARWEYGNPDAKCPADRVGEPYRITGLIDDSYGNSLFLCAICDSHFPTFYLVTGRNLEEALASFIERNEDYLSIEDCLEDYRGDNGEIDCHYSESGTPVDISLISVANAKLVSVSY